MNLSHKVDGLIQQKDLLKKGETVIVGVSGGADSVCLLHVLDQLRHKYGHTLIVAHYNHNLHTKADKDEAFVRQLAEEMNLECVVGTDKTLRLKTKGSLEELARNKRLSFFKRAAKSKKASVVALAHTQDDLAETVLMRLIRGAGTKGLRGILYERKLDGLKFVRPLLETSRKDIERYLKQNHLTYRRDPTNTNKAFLRNRVRLELLPLLERDYNNNIKEGLCHISNTSSIDYDFLEASAQKAFKAVARQKNAKHIELDRSKLKKQYQAIQRMILRQSVSALKGNTNRLTLKHVREFEHLISYRPAGSVLDLPSGISIQKSAKTLNIRRK